MIVALAALIALGAPLTSSANETWACTYLDFSPQHKPVVLVYEKNGADVTEVGASLLPGIMGQEKLHYTVVKDTNNGLVLMRYGETDPSVYALVVVINRTTGDYTRNALAAPSQRGAEATGSCVKK